MIIYLIQCTINGRYYVGKTTRTLNERWLEHCRDARNFRKSGALYSDLREFGVEAFTITELGKAYCQRRLNQMERQAIRVHKAAETGYNQAVAAFGGKPKRRPGTVTPQTAEQRAKNAASLRAYHERRRLAKVGVAA